jgi:hypothetical protein
MIADTMLQAQLKGKLTREEKDMEDLLVSNVFGSIKYIELKEGLIPILKASVNLDDKCPSIPFEQISHAHYEFWPSITEMGCKRCEPDVLITIRLEDNRKILLLVEAKLLSGKSSEADQGEAPNDQLAREYDNLLRKAYSDSSIPFFLFVTADFGYPTESVLTSNKEYIKKRKGKMQVFWISWRKITTLFKNEKKDSILYDLSKLMQKQRLIFYEGIMQTQPIVVSWSYEVSFSWKFEVPITRWDYQVTEKIKWQDYQTSSIKWRFDNEH